MSSSAALLLMMGHILSSWQGVEHVIFELYSTFFAEDHADVAALCYFSVRTFEARCQLVDTLINHYGDASKVAAWERLSTKIRKKSKVRNAIAHGLFIFFGKRPNRQAVVGRSIYDISKFPQRPRKNNFYTEKELKDAAISFIRLAREISLFRDNIVSDAKLQSKLRAPFQQAKENSRQFPLKGRIPIEP